MDKELQKDYKRFYMGNFEPDERMIKLDERLKKYYSDTPDYMDNKRAMPYWQEFNRWCSEHGYTIEEVNRAKKNCHISHF